jgi:two-component system, OmpR family, KDP operon response regulator KdpE
MGMKKQAYKLLVVDDEEAIRHFLRASLAAYQHTVIEANNGNTAIDLTVQARPDLVILDLGLPDMDGVNVIHEIREFSQVPIIVLSVRDGEEDKISALDEGADDYLTKPFSVGELLARMRGVMRRIDRPDGESSYQVADLKVDITRHMVFLKETEINLTPTEFTLLKLLMQNAGKVLTHRQIIDKVWGTHLGEEDRLLRVNVSNLRHKIEPDMNRPRYIRTELGVGYRLMDD